MPTFYFRTGLTSLLLLNFSLFFCKKTSIYEICRSARYISLIVLTSPVFLPKFIQNSHDIIFEQMLYQ